MNAPEHAADAVSPRLRLDQLPTVILTHLTRFVDRFDLHGDTLLYLALASPTLYAPCLRAAIQAGSTFQSRWLRAAGPDLVSRNVRMGNFATEKTPSSDPAQWFLVLPPRNCDRVHLSMHKAFGEEEAVMSRTWSLLPVPLSQFRHFSMNGNSEDCTMPPNCRSLTLVSRFGPRFPWSAVVLPISLFELELQDVTFPVSAEMQRVFGIMPPNLRSLKICNNYNVEGTAVSSAAYCDAMTWLLPLLPATITSLSFKRRRTFPAPVLREIAELIARLPSLASFTLAGAPSAEFALVFRALPRTELSHLDLTLRASLAEWDNLVASLPTAVGTLQFTCMSSAIGEVRLPPAANSLSVCLASWTASNCTQLPLAPTLRHLTLELGFYGGAECLEAIVTRIPASVTHLTLNKWPFGGTPTFRTLIAHLPPHLRSLTIKKCNITADDLSGCMWPESLQYLRLRHNRVTSPLSSLPQRLLLLDLGYNFHLARDMSYAWLARVLPASLRWFDVSMGSPVDAAMALIQWPHSPRASGQKTQVCLTDHRLSDALRRQLHEKFDVIPSSPDLPDLPF